jgi:hypothetical protein
MPEIERARSSAPPQTNCNAMIAPPPVAWTGPDEMTFFLTDDPGCWRVLLDLRGRLLWSEMIAEQKATVGLAKGVAGRSKKGQTRGSAGVPRIDEPPTLAEAGIDKHLADRARKLSAIPEKTARGREAAR